MNQTNQAIVNAKTRPDPRRAFVRWVVVLALLSYAVAQGALVPLDRLIAGWIVTLRSPWLGGPMRAVTLLGSSAWTAIGLLGLSMLAWRRRGMAGVSILLGAFVVGGAIEVALRLSVNHWRPDAVMIPPHPDLLRRLQLASFPSGHAFRAGFVWGWLARELGGVETRWSLPGRLLCLVVIGAVGLSRLSLNRHWASDIVGAWLVVFVVLAMSRLWEESPRARR